jgi:hypothetical protein
VGEQKHRPAQGIRRGFVAGGDKCQYVRSQLSFRDPFRFGIKRPQKMCQQVVWRIIRPLGQDSSTGGDDLIDLGFEKVERRADSGSTEPRDKVRYAKNIERAETRRPFCFANDNGRATSPAVVMEAISSHQ